MQPNPNIFTNPNEKEAKTEIAVHHPPRKTIIRHVILPDEHISQKFEPKTGDIELLVQNNETQTNPQPQQYPIIKRYDLK